MSQTPTILLIPIDNRPVTYRFPQLIASNAGLEAVTAPMHLIGSQHAPPSLDALTDWIEQSLSTIRPQAVFVGLDSILYGGLVASRRSLDPIATVQKRLERIANWKKIAGENLQIFAQASITRIPHYNASNTEPEYWKDYGEKIFHWSVLRHKQVLGLLQDASQLTAIEAEIPDEVLTDFTQRRERNFQANQSLIRMVKAGEIDYLVFSQDDTAAFGMNVQEKCQLLDLAKQDEVQNINAYAGTDEVLMTLMARWFAQSEKRPPQASLDFSPTDGNELISNFEGRTIGASVAAQMQAAKLELVAPGIAPVQDFALIVHTAGVPQGDHIALPGASQFQLLNSNQSVKTTIKLLENSTVPVVLCDVAYANGSDPLLIEQLLSRKDLLNKLYAYAGWNTTGNTVGSAIAVGAAHWYAKLKGTESKEACKQALFLRLADDWAYQAQVRSQLEGQASEERMRQLMAPLLQRLANALEFDPGPLNLKLPWNRTFEVEIDLDTSSKLIKGAHLAI